MQVIVYTLIGTLLLVLENYLRVSFPVWGMAPQLAFLLVVFMGFSGHAYRAVFLGFFLGFTIDSLSGGLPGMNAIIFAVCAAVMAKGKRSFYLRSITFEVVSVAAVSTLAVLLKIGLLYFFSLGRGLTVLLLSNAPKQILLNVVAGLVMYPFLFRIDEATDLSRRGSTFSSTAW
jgi:rod shape-determining protein MreD